MLLVNVDFREEQLREWKTGLLTVDWENAAVGGKNASGGEEKTAVGKKHLELGEMVFLD